MHLLFNISACFFSKLIVQKLVGYICVIISNPYHHYTAQNEVNKFQSRLAALHQAHDSLKISADLDEAAMLSLSRCTAAPLVNISR